MDPVTRRMKAIENDTIRRTGSIVEVVQDGYDTYTRVRNWYNGRTQWVVVVESGDRLYDAALRWFISADLHGKPPRQVKAVMNRAARFRHLDFEDMPTKGKPGIDLLYDERGTQKIIVDGHKVKAALFSMARTVAAAGGDQGFRPTQPDSLTFYCSSFEAQRAVIRVLEQIAGDQQKAKPALHLLSQWGDWQRRDDLPERQLSSVVLAEGQMERLRQDLQDFLDSESEYTRRGMPYHRGYLLDGPPGTGKTSVVRALAAHFGLDLWYAPLGDLQKDTNLLALINQVKAGSILLLEDVDVFSAMHDRATKDAEEGGLSTAGLLNALDGVATPHGLITFMTTNNRDVIDPAILRPGRIDVQEEIGLPNADQIRRLYNSWYATELTVPLTQDDNSLILFQGSTAQVTELFKQHLNDPRSALVALSQPPVVADKRSVTVSLKEKRNERSNGRAAGSRNAGTRRGGSSPQAEAGEDESC